jgi:hypothetical protein
VSAPAVLIPAREIARNVIDASVNLSASVASQFAIRRVFARALLVGIIATTGASFVLAVSGASAARNKRAVSPAASHRPISHSELALHDEMRKLCEDHIVWTRNVIISFQADLPDLNAAIGRLLQNQADIGNAISPTTATRPATS